MFNYINFYIVTHAVLAKESEPHTVQSTHTVLLVRVHGKYTYFPVPQTVQEVQGVSLVELQAVLAYWPAPQTVQWVHTVLPVLDVYVPAAQDEHTLTPVVAP